MQWQLAYIVSCLCLCLLVEALQGAAGENKVILGGAGASALIVDNSTASHRHWSEGEQWWEQWPLPVTQAVRIEAGGVMQLLEDIQAGKDIARDFLLVDVRRQDWEEGGAITTSINVPAHAVYHARGMLYELCKRADIKRIIFFCRSSNGRGPRCASWMQDYINEVGGEGIESVVMDGGVKGWAKTFGGRMMERYDEEYWRQDA